jgi:protein SCO1/2
MIAALTLAVSMTQLEDQRGRAFTFASLRGEPAIVTFVSAHCTDTCPLTNAQFARTERDIAREGLRVRLVTITLDPERDSLAVMRSLASKFGANPRYWIVADGTPRNVHRVMRAFGVFARRGKDGYEDVHTTYVYLLNSNGELAGAILPSGGDYLIGEIRRYLTAGSQ